MKKTIFLILASVCSIVAIGQSTVSSLPDYYYFLPGWNTDIASCAGPHKRSIDNPLVMYYIPTDTITIYGISGSYICDEFYDDSILVASQNCGLYYDTIFDSSFVYAQLYDFHTADSTIEVLDKKRVHIRDTPPTLWLETDVGNWPFYETYFDQPRTYAPNDTIYWGTARNINFLTYVDGSQLFTTFGMDAHALGYSCSGTCNLIWCPSDRARVEECEKWIYYPGMISPPLIFLLTAPNPKATEGIGQVGGNVSELTISPNPAQGLSEVRCDVPMAELQVCDAVGRVLLRQQGGSTTLTLDTRSLRAGFYIVRALPCDGSAPRSARLCVAR